MARPKFDDYAWLRAENWREALKHPDGPAQRRGRVRERLAPVFGAQPGVIVDQGLAMKNLGAGSFFRARRA